MFKRLDLTSSRSPYMLGRAASIDYGRFSEKCPNALRACQQEAVWLMHNLFLGDTRDVDILVEAIFKIREQHRELLGSSGRKP